MRRFVVCGEALIDLVPTAASEGTRSSDWKALSAGGPMNTAIGLARLGHDVAFLGRLGSDAFARQLRAHLQANGVDLGLAVSADEATSLAIVSLDDDGAASYAFHFHETANFGWRPGDLPPLGADDWLHIGSLVTVVEPGAGVLLDWVRRGEGPVSFDLNVRPGVEPDPARYWRLVEPWLAAVGGRGGVVRGSDEDFSFVAAPGGLPEDPPALAAELRRRYGVSCLALTLGAAGAFVADAAGAWVVPAPPTRVVDTIGAGDTFMAGFLSGLVIDRLGAERALRRGVRAAAIVCEREGADPPSRAELDEA